MGFRELRWRMKNYMWESIGPAGRARGIKYMEGQRVTLNRDEELGQM